MSLCLSLFPQQLSGLWYHNRINHPDVFASHTRQLKTLVQCDVCFKFFPSAASVARHQAAEHQGEDHTGLDRSLMQLHIIQHNCLTNLRNLMISTSEICCRHDMPVTFMFNDHKPKRKIIQKARLLGSSE